LFADKFIMENVDLSPSQPQPLSIKYIDVNKASIQYLDLTGGLKTPGFYYVYAPGMPGEYFYSTDGDRIAFLNHENPRDGLTFMTIKYHPHAASKLFNTKILQSQDDEYYTKLLDKVNIIVPIPSIPIENWQSESSNSEKPPPPQSQPPPQSAGSRNRRSRKNRSKKSKKSKSRKH
jgi:hypothetical protein